MSTTALVLAGHGSQISPNTAGIVWGYIDKLRAMGIADEITAAFWKEFPDFRGVLDSLESENIVIVPVFTAQGFFTQKVIPAEMQLGERKNIFYTRTLGEHPYLSEIVQQRIENALKDASLKPEDATIAIIGHGTQRISSSQEATRQQAEILRQTGKYSQVLDVYLDAEPAIISIYQDSQQQNIIAVPFFLAEGSHVSIDVPEALGINYGDYPATIEGFQLYYTPPVGTDDSICELILELANESGLPFSTTEAKDWTSFPKVGSSELLETLHEAKELIFGQLVLKFDTVYPIDSTMQLRIESSHTLRKHLRENPYRPLAFSDDLPQDWFVPIQHPAQIPAVLETVYPQALAEWAVFRQGRLHIESLESLIGRQQGMFSEIQLEQFHIQKTIRQVCGRCTRQPLWAEPNGSKLPCPRACNYWLSQYQDET